jgi:hypothetical protein
VSRTDLLGYAASAAVLATFCMNSMLCLRLVAIGSNILFIWFGAMAHIHPVLLLHLILLPVNLRRLTQIWRPSAATMRLSATANPRRAMAVIAEVFSRVRPSKSMQAECLGQLFALSAAVLFVSLLWASHSVASSPAPF